MSARQDAADRRNRWAYGRRLIDAKRLARTLVRARHVKASVERLRDALYFFVGLRPRAPREVPSTKRRAELVEALRPHETAARKKTMRVLLGPLVSTPAPKANWIVICDALDKPVKGAHWQALTVVHIENVPATERELEELGLIDRRRGVALIYADSLELEFVRR